MGFNISSDAGRIGPFWWLNSNTAPWTMTSPQFDGLRLVRWGAFGIGGRIVFIDLEVVQ